MLFLCSQSPTRAGLLERYGIDFVQKKVDFDEEAIATRDAGRFVYEASRGKLDAAERRYGLAVPLLTADSVVVAEDGTLLRKAATMDEARAILGRQSASHIRIITSLHYKSRKRLFIDTSATHYYFDPFDPEELERYLASGEWEGKAGACMVEGFCRRYIRSVRGEESTAMGLQIERLLPWLEPRG